MNEMEFTPLSSIKCKRCGIEELFPLEQIEKQVIEYAKALDEDLRVTDTEYKSRLEICFDCDGLISGLTCKYCGCFVQIRALNKHRHCPTPSGGLW